MRHPDMADAEAVTPGSRGDVARGWEVPKPDRVWPAKHSEGWLGLQSDRRACLSETEGCKKDEMNVDLN